jgi:hypothetical protein
VLAPFARRFPPDKPFRPVNIRGYYIDGDTVIVIADGTGTTIVDTAYENTYRFREGWAALADALRDTTDGMLERAGDGHPWKRGSAPCRPRSTR